MPASTTITCDDCGTNIDAVTGMAHPALFLNYSHPLHGGAGAYYCLDCADRILLLLPGLEVHDRIRPAVAEAQPEPEPVVEPEQVTEQ